MASLEDLDFINFFPWIIVQLGPTHFKLCCIFYRLNDPNREHNKLNSLYIQYAIQNAYKLLIPLDIPHFKQIFFFKYVHSSLHPLGIHQDEFDNQQYGRFLEFRIY